MSGHPTEPYITREQQDEMQRIAQRHTCSSCGQMCEQIEAERADWKRWCQQRETQQGELIEALEERALTVHDDGVLGPGTAHSGPFAECSHARCYDVGALIDKLGGRGGGASQ
jgi:hypothetical protein